MLTKKLIQALFVVAAAYDGLLGLLFLLAPRWMFAQFEVPPPGHDGYVQFPAALLLVFAWMFVRVAKDPCRFRALIPFGMGLKVSYCAVVFAHWATGGISWIWKPFAFADLAFLLAFAAAWRSLEKGSGFD